MSATSTTSAIPSQSLNQADFLNLLVTQMSSQDPLNPESDTDFAAQLAQFSSLQETQTMAGDLQNIQATGLMGQTVTISPGGGVNPITGIVSAVQISSGTPQLTINGQNYPLSEVTTEGSTAATTTTAGSTATSTSGSTSSSSSASGSTSNSTATSTPTNTTSTTQN